MSTKEKEVRDKIVSHLATNGTMQIWLAEKADVSPGYLNNILTGKRKMNADVLLRINKALKTRFKL